MNRPASTSASNVFITYIYSIRYTDNLDFKILLRAALFISGDLSSNCIEGSSIRKITILIWNERCPEVNNVAHHLSEFKLHILNTININTEE